MPPAQTAQSSGLHFIPPSRGSSRSSYTERLILRAGSLCLFPRAGIAPHTAATQHQGKELLGFGLLLQLLTVLPWHSWG